MLDLACGHGRHSLELARRGYRVTGLDLSAPSLDVARTRAHDETLEVEFGAAMLSDAGLELERAYGGFDGSELGLDSRRLIVLARKR